MIKDFVIIAELRVLIGYLGEQQPSWWSSRFFDSTASAFLGPVFTRSTALAQYRGVTAAAARKHDEHIGQGLTFHLFRLPEFFEQSVAGAFADTAFVNCLYSSIIDRDHALARLEKLAGNPAVASEGPLVIGDFSNEHGNVPDICAAIYLDAFKKGIQCFPYFREAQ